MSWRKIVVDGTEYEWKYGLSYTTVRLDGKSFAKYDTTTLLGLTEDVHERAIWKRTMNRAVTPSVVAEAIRNQRKESAPRL